MSLTPADPAEGGIFIDNGAEIGWRRHYTGHVRSHGLLLPGEVESIFGSGLIGELLAT